MSAPLPAVPERSAAARPAAQPGELAALLKRLHLAHARRTYGEFIERAEREAWSFHEFLLALAREEVAHRAETRIQRCVRKARFPQLKTVEEFEFSVQPELRRTLLGSCFGPEFVDQGRNLILTGRSGRGKTHLATAIAYRAIQNGYDALFSTAAALIDDLSRASHEGRFLAALKAYVQPAVLAIDRCEVPVYVESGREVPSSAGLSRSVTPHSSGTVVRQSDSSHFRMLVSDRQAASAGSTCPIVRVLAMASRFVSRFTMA